MKNFAITLFVLGTATVSLHADWQNSSPEYYYPEEGRMEYQSSSREYSDSTPSNLRVNVRGYSYDADQNQGYYAPDYQQNSSQYSGQRYQDGRSYRQDQDSGSNYSYNQPYSSDSKNYDSRRDSKNEFPQDRYATQNDQQLNNAIRDKISRGWFVNSYKDLQLNTSNGVVTVEGTVDNVDDQQKVITEINKVNGVRSVVNRLRVQKQR